MQVTKGPDAGDGALGKKEQLVFLPNFAFGTAYPSISNSEKFKIV